MTFVLVLVFLMVKSIVFKILTLLLYLGSFSTAVLTFLINPGITFKEKPCPNGKAYYCQTCKFTYPKNDKPYTHCYSCNICCADMDHHCGVFGKCIGYKNKILFYTFPVCSMFLLVMSLVSIFYHFMGEKKKNQNDTKL